MSQIYVAMLAISNTLSNTSYAMINLECIKEIFDSKGFDENKTSLLDFILDSKFKHKFESIKIDIDMADHCSASEYENEFKYHFDLEKETYTIVNLSHMDYAKLEENYNLIEVQMKELDKFTNFLDKVTREMLKNKVQEKVKI